MVYLKGELSKGASDSGWPHQVALPADRRTGRNYVTSHLFCEGLSLCPRGHSFYCDDVDMTVFCFADQAHAEQFGGELIDPKERPKMARLAHVTHFITVVDLMEALRRSIEGQPTSGKIKTTRGGKKRA